ncbi:MAG: PBP1A family penicillin-binding protein [Patescibacteria group bacterium]|nr:PBP1A family penicillin-binding protein [Patescibacteria group bacterium]
MPIPQFKSNFQRRKIGDNKPAFSYRKIDEVSAVAPAREKKPKRIFIFSKKDRSSKKPGRFFWRLIRRLWPYVLALFFLGGIFVVSLFAWYSRDLPEPGKIIDRSIALSTKIYDRSGEVLLYEIHGDQKRTLVSLDDIPTHVRNATIAIEDKNFYSHRGISFWSIVRAQVVPRLQGRRAQGGSTLTQQFVKNAILTSERKVSRKIKEWILSYQIERRFEKDQILEFYLNEIPYGGAVYGVQAAANYYFDKNVQDISLAEAAILAALPQGPTRYSPYGNNKDLLIGRQQYILDLMVDQGYVSRAEADIAKAQELVFKRRAEQIKAPHFVMYIRELLEREYSASLVEQSGWEIITSLDWDMQQTAERVINEVAPRNLETYQAGNAALVAIDTDSGQVRAMVGSRNYFDDSIDGQVNVALALRQPGSSFKPFVYLKAFEKGYRPETILFDLKTKFGVRADGTPYEPPNYDGREHGPVTMRQALAGSLNIPAVKTLYLAGVNDTVTMARDFGYSSLTDPDRYGLSLVLGGAEVRLLEHTNAYATLAREGVHKDAVVILEIRDARGKVIEKVGENKGRRVMERDLVRLVNDVLSDNSARAYIFGENNRLTLPDRPVAAKTGTTNDYRDAWTMGFVPQIATGVWVGNNRTEMGRGADGSIVAAPIWQAFMREVTKDLAVEAFAKHELPTCNKPMVCGELSGGQAVAIDRMSGKLATEYTPYTTIEEKNFIELHSILHYVNKNDPLGSMPDNPASDPQYNAWEEAVRRYAEDEGYTIERPPTEYDDIHLPHLRPNISWRYPASGQTINQTNLTLSVETDAPLGVARVEYFLDGLKIGESRQAPFDFSYQINPFTNNGQRELKAIAFDDLENFRQSIISINLQLDSSAREFNIFWLDPQNGDTLQLSQRPFRLNLRVDKPESVQKIDFYYIDTNNQSRFFGYLSSFASENISINLDRDLSPGVYKLYLMVKDQTGNLLTVPGIVVNIEE